MTGNLDMADESIKGYTFNHFLKNVQSCEDKKEFVDGNVVNMAGASEAHNVLVTSLVALIYPHVKGGPCKVTGGDMLLRIKTDTMDRGRYPDVLVSCARAAEGRYYTTAHLVIEVASPTTVNVDRSDKVFEYSHVLYGGDYLVVHQDQILVERFKVGSVGVVSWDRYHAGDTIKLTKLHLELSVDEIYEDLIGYNLHGESTSG